MNVKDVMTAAPACCTADTSLHEVAKLMVNNDCGCIPVVSDSTANKPVGMITDRDIVIRTVAQGKNPLELTAADAMSPNPVTVTPTTSLEDCCNLMESNQVRRVAVVDEAGACCGIIAQADVALNAKDSKTAEVVQEVSKSVSA